MKIYTTIQRGHLHKVFCEDFLWTAIPHPNWVIGAVADGCSSGQDSHFASALTCKILRKQVEKTKFEQAKSPKEVALDLLHSFMADFRQTIDQLALNILEVLSTLLLVIHDVRNKQTFIVILGDGVVAINDQIYNIDQENSPNYPAYYREESKENLDIYFLKHYFEVENAKQIAIATDGVLKFQNEKNLLETNLHDVVVYLLTDHALQNVESMLNRKMNLLAIKQHTVPIDDVAIVRFIF